MPVLGRKLPLAETCEGRSSGPVCRCGRNAWEEGPVTRGASEEGMLDGFCFKDGFMTLASQFTSKWFPCVHNRDNNSAPQHCYE